MQRAAQESRAKSVGVCPSIRTDSSVRVSREHNRIKRDSTNIISEETTWPRLRHACASAADRAERTEGWNLELGDGHAHLPHGRIRRFTLPRRTPAVEAPHASKSRRPKSPGQASSSSSPSVDSVWYRCVVRCALCVIRFVVRPLARTRTRDWTRSPYVRRRQRLIHLARPWIPYRTDGFSN